MRINEGALKVITRKKMQPCTSKNIALVIIRFFQTNLVFIAIMDSFCNSLFKFLPFDF